MKRIIFDIDNTLIPWKEEYVSSILDNLGSSATYEEGLRIYNEIGHYSDVCKKLDKEEICKRLDISIKLFNNILESQKDCVDEIDDSIKETLEYLESKYELVILTNWFEEVQVERLKKVGIYKYFKEIYCSDKYPSKPNEEAFISALNGVDKSDAVMIGDNFKIDIIPAVNMGLKAVWITNKDVSSDEYSVIHNISELKEMF